MIALVIVRIIINESVRFTYKALLPTFHFIHSQHNTSPIQKKPHPNKGAAKKGRA